MFGRRMKVFDQTKKRYVRISLYCRKDFDCYLDTSASHCCCPGHIEATAVSLVFMQCRDCIKWAMKSKIKLQYVWRTSILQCELHIAIAQMPFQVAFAWISIKNIYIYKWWNCDQLNFVFGARVLFYFVASLCLSSYFISSCSISFNNWMPARNQRFSIHHRTYYLVQFQLVWYILSQTACCWVLTPDFCTNATNYNRHNGAPQY